MIRIIKDKKNVHFSGLSIWQSCVTPVLNWYPHKNLPMCSDYFFIYSLICIYLFALSFTPCCLHVNFPEIRFATTQIKLNISFFWEIFAKQSVTLSLKCYTNKLIKNLMKENKDQMLLFLERFLWDAKLLLIALLGRKGNAFNLTLN